MMDSWVVWSIIGLALVFDYVNGMHDAANSIATIVSTRVMKPQWAVVWAAFFNFVAFLFFGLHVAKTIGKGVVDPAAADLPVVTAGLVGAMLVGYSNGATLRMGDSYLLPSIAAVVIGGSSILGGSGTFIGTVGGAILLTTLSTVISAIGLSEGWRTVIEGGIIIVALMVLRGEVLSQIGNRLLTRRR